MQELNCYYVMYHNQTSVPCVVSLANTIIVPSPRIVFLDFPIFGYEFDSHSYHYLVIYQLGNINVSLYTVYKYKISVDYIYITESQWLKLLLLLNNYKKYIITVTPKWFHLERKWMKHFVLKFIKFEFFDNFNKKI